jgi:alpha-tubulin suppressor-like RCC1 family protein
MRRGVGLSERHLNNVISESLRNILREDKWDRTRWGQNSNGYIPNPQNLDDYEIPQEINRAADDIARNAHEGWSANKMNNGYVYSIVK